MSRVDGDKADVEKKTDGEEVKVDKPIGDIASQFKELEAQAAKDRKAKPKSKKKVIPNPFLRGRTEKQQVENWVNSRKQAKGWVDQFLKRAKPC